MGEGRIVFTNANLLDGDNAAQPGTSVIVQGNRITSISTKAVPTTAEDRVIDLSGKTLMPGLISSHFHTGFGPAPEQAPRVALGPFRAGRPCGWPAWPRP